MIFSLLQQKILYDKLFIKIFDMTFIFYEEIWWKRLINHVIIKLSKENFDYNKWRKSLTLAKEWIYIQNV